MFEIFRDVITTSRYLRILVRYKRSHEPPTCLLGGWQFVSSLQEMIEREKEEHADVSCGLQYSLLPDWSATGNEIHHRK